MTSPLFSQDRNRFVTFPIQYHDVWEMYKKSVSSFWTTEEIDLSRDMKDWPTLSKDERHFIKMVLAFFAASDGIVNYNLVGRFMNEVHMPEAKSFYSFQIAIEQIHAEMYSLLIDTYEKDADERSRLFNAVQTIPTIGKKADWAMRWIDGDNSKTTFAHRLVAFACVEGIFFSGAFCAIYWIKERGLMPGLTVSNELISRDEAMHVEFAVLLYNKYCDMRLSTEEAHRMVKEALAIEKEFVIDAIPCQLLGMSVEQMSHYVEFVADRLLLQLGYPKLYNSKNPFPFMERIGIEGKTNFFEQRVSEYSIANIQRPSTFDTEVDF